MLFSLIANASNAFGGSDAKINNYLIGVNSALNEKMNNIDDKANISVVEEEGGKFIIKTPIVSYSGDSGEKKYRSIIFLKKDVAKQFGTESGGISFRNTKNSKFNKNIISTKNDSFKIELAYINNPGESDEIMLWGKTVTLVFY